MHRYLKGSLTGLFCLICFYGFDRSAQMPLAAMASQEAEEVKPQVKEQSPEDQVAAVAIVLAPLLDVIADVEGGPQALNAVNRGHAGDTPHGSFSVLGRNLTEMTVAEVMHAQRWTVFAVGAYQFIPQTLKSLVTKSKFDVSRRFDKVAQQELAVLAIKYLRPQVWAYILGEPVSARRAALEMAKEWASIGHPADNRSYYSGVSGNAAKISTHLVSDTLLKARGMLAIHEVVK